MTARHGFTGAIMRHVGMRGRALTLGAALVAVTTFGVMGVGGIATASTGSGVPEPVVSSSAGPGSGASGAGASGLGISGSGASTGITAPGSQGDPPDPALAHAVAAWVSGGGETDLTALGTDFSSLEDAANAGDLPQMSASCQQLQSDVKTAQQYDPIPDAAAQADWAGALAQYALGATDCVAGADASSAALMTKASKEITAGSAELDKVTARLAQIAG